MRMPEFTADAALFDENRYVANVVPPAPDQSSHHTVIPQIHWGCLVLSIGAGLLCGHPACGVLVSLLCNEGKAY